MITNDEAQKNYNNARKALNQIIRSDTATEEERRQATRQRDALILNYIGRQIDDVHARSAAYAKFIEAMAALIVKLGPDRPLQGLQMLGGIVNQAAALIGTIQPKEGNQKPGPGK
jgi:hypothetical protein